MTSPCADAFAALFAALARASADERAAFYGAVVCGGSMDVDADALTDDARAALQLFGAWVGIAGNDAPDERRRKIAAALARHPPSPALWALYGCATRAAGAALAARDARRTRLASQRLGLSSAQRPWRKGHHGASALSALAVRAAPQKLRPPAPMAIVR